MKILYFMNCSACCNACTCMYTLIYICSSIILKNFRCIDTYVYYCIVYAVLHLFVCKSKFLNYLELVCKYKYCVYQYTDLVSCFLSRILFVYIFTFILIGVMIFQTCGDHYGSNWRRGGRGWRLLLACSMCLKR